MRRDHSVLRRDVDRSDRFFRISAQLHERRDAPLFKSIAVAIPKNGALVGIEIKSPVLDLISVCLAKRHLGGANCVFISLHRIAIRFGRHVYSLLDVGWYDIGCGSRFVQLLSTPG